MCDSARVMVWCTPRVVSTALTKCLSGIEGMEVWFEPYVYALSCSTQYKTMTGRDLPMSYDGHEKAFEVAGAEVSRLVGSELEPKKMAFQSVKQNLEKTASDYVLVKDMAMSMVSDECRKYIPSGYRHAFLIRHPTITYESYREALHKQVLAIGDLRDDARDFDKFDIERDDTYLPSSTFYQDLHSLWKYVQESGIDPNPVVLDADDLLTKPAETLPKFCRAVGLPYSDSLLEWDASLDVVDTWKAAGDTLCRDYVNFYGKAMRSSRFEPPSRKQGSRDQLHADVIKLSNSAIPVYNELCLHKI